jgi:HD-GYP domain-containing protein (c-di-GMP phosphodiesterase class II)
MENQLGYTKAAEAAKSIITISQVTGQVPYEQVCDIRNLVFERIKLTDPALLFQCINGNNEIDEYLFRHSTNVAIINGLMGKWLGFPIVETEDLVMLGLVHDIGKMRVPPEILNSPGKLTEAEFEVIKKHAVYSYDMLNENKSFSEKIKKAALSHHEKMNGSGYPEHLTANQIPIYAKITSISDIYDAMVSQRCYKSAVSPFRVLQQLATEQFSELDTKLVKLFINQMPNELVGKQVFMSNGSVGVVKLINETNLEYPVVEIAGEIILTNKDLYCLSMMIEGV